MKVGMVQRDPGPYLSWGLGTAGGGVPGPGDLLDLGM